MEKKGRKRNQKEGHEKRAKKEGKDKEIGEGRREGIAADEEEGGGKGVVQQTRE